MINNPEYMALSQEVNKINILLDVMYDSHPQTAIEDGEPVLSREDWERVKIFPASQVYLRDQYLTRMREIEQEELMGGNLNNMSNKVILDDFNNISINGGPATNMTEIRKNYQAQQQQQNTFGNNQNVFISGQMLAPDGTVVNMLDSNIPGVDYAMEEQMLNNAYNEYQAYKQQNQNNNYNYIPYQQQLPQFGYTPYQQQEPVVDDMYSRYESKYIRDNGFNSLQQVPQFGYTPYQQPMMNYNNPNQMIMSNTNNYYQPTPMPMINYQQPAVNFNNDVNKQIEMERQMDLINQYQPNNQSIPYVGGVKLNNGDFVRSDVRQQSGMMGMINNPSNNIIDGKFYSDVSGKGEELKDKMQPPPEKTETVAASAIRNLITEPHLRREKMKAFNDYQLEAAMMNQYNVQNNMGPLPFQTYGYYESPYLGNNGQYGYNPYNGYINQNNMYQQNQIDYRYMMAPDGSINNFYGYNPDIQYSGIIPQRPIYAEASSIYMPEYRYDNGYDNMPYAYRPDKNKKVDVSNLVIDDRIERDKFFELSSRPKQVLINPITGMVDNYGGLDSTQREIVDKVIPKPYFYNPETRTETYKYIAPSPCGTGISVDTFDKLEEIDEDILRQIRDVTYENYIQGASSHTQKQDMLRLRNQAINRKVYVLNEARQNSLDLAKKLAKTAARGVGEYDEYYMTDEEIDDIYTDKVLSENRFDPEIYEQFEFRNKMANYTVCNNYHDTPEFQSQQMVHNMIKREHDLCLPKDYTVDDYYNNAWRIYNMYQDQAEVEKRRSDALNAKIDRDIHEIWMNFDIDYISNYCLDGATNSSAAIRNIIGNDYKLIDVDSRKVLLLSKNLISGVDWSDKYLLLNNVAELKFNEAPVPEDKVGIFDLSVPDDQALFYSLLKGFVNFINYSIDRTYGFTR